MKVIVAVVLAIGSVSALGSGPYLPSGWRPQGPAFFLPGEVQKPADNPLKEVIVFENEASSSDALREYGPPKEASENVISQGLPDVVTDQTFLVVEDKGAVSAVVEIVALEENVEQKSEQVQEQTTEAQLVEEKATVAYERIADIELQADVTTALYAEEAKSEELEARSGEVELKSEETEVKSEESEVKSEVEVKTEEIQATVATVEKLEQTVVQEVETVEVGVKNIAEALVNLENEIKAEQVQSEAVVEVKINQEGSGSAQVPEGFLEYGPPGFREYGPPKRDELLRSAAVILEEPTNSVADSNDARRRRFSPKFKASKNKKAH